MSRVHPLYILQFFEGGHNLVLLVIERFEFIVKCLVQLKLEDTLVDKLKIIEITINHFVYSVSLFALLFSFMYSAMKMDKFFLISRFKRTQMNLHKNDRSSTEIYVVQFNNKLFTK